MTDIVTLLNNQLPISYTFVSVYLDMTLSESTPIGKSKNAKKEVITKLLHPLDGEIQAKNNLW